MSDAELICSSLEKIAETVEDISPMVYARLFTERPEIEEMLGNDPGGVLKGQMLNGILHAVMRQSEGTAQPRFCYWWAMDHMSQNVTPAMCESMFEAIVEVLHECLGADWDVETAAAWQRQLDAILEVVEEAARNFELAKRTNALPAFPRTSIQENVPASVAG